MGVEHEVLFSGIGGQGVQLAATVLARAALAEGRDVQLFGSYGGMMRGGNTEATVVMSDDVVDAPPTVGRAWGAVVMHSEYSAGVVGRLRPGGVLLVNTSVWPDPPHPADSAVLEVPATDLAADAGGALAAGMVMLGALSAATGLVGLDALAHAAADAVPAYRAEHRALNDAALRAGYASVPSMTRPAWDAPVRGGRR